MKMISTIGAAALAPLLALSPVLAQDNASSAASSALSATPSVEANASAETSAKADMSGLIAALTATNAPIDLSAVTEASVINLVTVSSLPPSETPDALTTAVDTNKARIDKLRTDVGANAAISAKLSDAGYKADQVLAVVTETDGSITVYVDDRT